MVEACGFEEAQNIAAVLRPRIAAAIAREARAGRSRRTPRMVAGLILKAIGSMDAVMRRALGERSELIEARASAVLGQALLAGEAWTRFLGTPPRGSTAPAWRQHACTVAAYRDRYGIVGGRPVGPVPESAAQRLDAGRARAALDAARRLSGEHQTRDALRPPVAAGLRLTGHQSSVGGLRGRCATPRTTAQLE